MNSVDSTVILRNSYSWKSAKNFQKQKTKTTEATSLEDFAKSAYRVPCIRNDN